MGSRDRRAIVSGAGLALAAVCWAGCATPPSDTPLPTLSGTTAPVVAPSVAPQDGLFYFDAIAGRFSTLAFAWDLAVAACGADGNASECRLRSERALGDAEQLRDELESREAELRELLARSEFPEPSAYVEAHHGLERAIDQLIDGLEARLAALAAADAAALAAADLDVEAAVDQINRLAAQPEGPQLPIRPLATPAPAVPSPSAAASPSG